MFTTGRRNLEKYLILVTFETKVKQILHVVPSDSKTHTIKSIKTCTTSSVLQDKRNLVKKMQLLTHIKIFISTLMLASVFFFYT